MKFLIMLSLSLTAVSAMACPDLSGNYKCAPTEVGDTGVNSISFENNTYTWIEQDYMSKTEFIVDGKSHDMGNGIFYTCSCTETALTCLASAPGYSAELETSLNAKKDLVKKSTSTQNGQTVPEEEVCSRI
jgi:hypothetical protein